jgi:hypothetical protein
VEKHLDHSIPERLLTCVVEEWCDPSREPLSSWHDDIRPGTKEWVWAWQIEARRRQRAARATYRTEHDITEPWPAQGRPMWRRASE